LHRHAHILLNAFDELARGWRGLPAGDFGRRESRSRQQENAPRFLLRRRWWRGVFLVLAGRRIERGFGAAAVAGKAPDVGLTVGEFAVDVRSHLDHHASHQLFVLVVTCEVALDVAEIASHAQRSGESTHGRDEVRTRFEDLEVLRSGHFTARRRWPLGLLGEQRNGKG